MEDILRELNANLEKLEAQAIVANKFHSLQADQEEKQKLLWLLRKNEAATEQGKYARHGASPDRSGRADRQAAPRRTRTRTHAPGPLRRRRPPAPGPGPSVPDQFRNRQPGSADQVRDRVAQPPAEPAGRTDGSAQPVAHARRGLPAADRGSRVPARGTGRPRRAVANGGRGARRTLA
ncbi:hypothetical protein LP419_37135 [Massilia sp. H-1]|nr:hypothetical protein LP419_37135 [Massilia sp. H-1]